MTDTQVNSARKAGVRAFLPAAAWYAVIFAFSAQTGEESGQLSGRIVHGSIDLIVPGCPKSYWESMKKMKESFHRLKRQLSQAATRLSTDLGFKLDSGFLSTGCKAALETVRCGEKEIIDLIECGMNARDCIISNCKNGSILISRPECRISDYSEDDLVDVSVYGKQFTSMRLLSRYLEEV